MTEREAADNRVEMTRQLVWLAFVLCELNGIEAKEVPPKWPPREYTDGILARIDRCAATGVDARQMIKAEYERIEALIVSSLSSEERPRWLAEIGWTLATDPTPQAADSKADEGDPS